MAKDQRARIKGRKNTEPFVGIPKRIVRSAEFRQLSAQATKVLVHMLADYTGNNNGDLSLSWSVMKKKGWKSPDTLNHARKELLCARFIEVTRQGGLHKCSLYAVTWAPIDECGGKLDSRSTIKPSDAWKNETTNTETVFRRYGNRTNEAEKKAA